MAGPICALCQETILDTEPRSTYHAIVAYLYKPTPSGPVCKDLLTDVSFRGKRWDPATAPARVPDSERLPIHNRCQAVIRRAAKRLGIEPPGGGRGKSKKTVAAASVGGRKRRHEPEAPAPAAEKPRTSLELLVAAFRTCSVLVGEQAVDSLTIFAPRSGRSAKMGKRDQGHTSAGGQLPPDQLLRLRGAFLKSVATAAQELRQAAFFLGQATGERPMGGAQAPAPAHYTSSAGSGPMPAPAPGRARGLPTGHAGPRHGGGHLPFAVAMAGGREVSGAASLISSIGTPALPTSLAPGPTPRTGLASTRVSGAHSTMTSRAYGAEAASTVGGGDALSKFAAVAAEAWERESAASGLSAGPSRSRGSATRASSRPRRGVWGQAADAGAGTVESGGASNHSAGRSSSSARGRGPRGPASRAATPLSPTPGEGSEVGVLLPPPDGARAESVGGVSDSDSIRAAPAAAAGLTAALGVAFAAEDDADRFDPFDFIEAADLRPAGPGGVRSGAAGDSASVGVPPAPAPLSAARRLRGSVVSPGGTADREGGGIGPLFATGLDLGPPPVGPPVTPHGGDIGEGHPLGGTVGAAGTEVPRAGSALSSLMGMGRALGVGGPGPRALSVASSSGVQPFPSPTLRMDSGSVGDSAFALGGDVMGLRPVGSGPAGPMSAASSPSLRPRPRLAPASGPLGGGTGTGSSTEEAGGWAGAGLEGLYGYTAWGAGALVPSTPLASPTHPRTESAARSLMGARVGSEAPAHGAGGPGGVGSGRPRLGSAGSGHGFSSEGLVASASTGGLAQLDGDAAASREW